MLLWLRACHEQLARFMGTRRGVQLVLGRRFVLARLRALFSKPRAVRDAILPVSLAQGTKQHFENNIRSA